MPNWKMSKDDGGLVSFLGLCLGEGYQLATYAQMSTILIRKLTSKSTSKTVGITRILKMEKCGGQPEFVLWLLDGYLSESVFLRCFHSNSRQLMAILYVFCLVCVFFSSPGKRRKSGRRTTRSKIHHQAIKPKWKKSRLTHIPLVVVWIYSFATAGGVGVILDEMTPLLVISSDRLCIAKSPWWMW